MRGFVSQFFLKDYLKLIDKTQLLMLYQTNYHIIEITNNNTSCLIVNTIKGKGFNIMENKPNWHYWNPVDQKTYDKILKDLNKKYE